MTHREAWEAVSFQVFTDEEGVLRSGFYPSGEGTVEGNVQVDFVWGNVPLQPDDDRTDEGFSFGGGLGDNGWASAYQYTSDTLRTAPYYNNDAVQGLFDIIPLVPADSHTIATTGWSNFPGFIPNYAGDGDSGLEAVVPQLMRKTLAQAEYELDKVNLDLFATGHNIDIEYIESDGTTVRVYAYDTNPWDDELALVGLRPGDKVYVDNDLYTFGDLVTITAVNADGNNSWIEFKTETALNLDDYASGNIWAGPDLVEVITVIRFWNPEGSIKNEGTNIHVRYLND
jgi:hypothetical protein